MISNEVFIGFKDIRPFVKLSRYDIYSFEVFTENKLRLKRKSQLIVYDR